MMAMTMSLPQTQPHSKNHDSGSCSDRDDDSDVAFACMDFDGVDFGDDPDSSRSNNVDTTINDVEEVRDAIILDKRKSSQEKKQGFDEKGNHTAFTSDVFVDGGSSEVEGKGGTNGATDKEARVVSKRGEETTKCGSGLIDGGSYGAGNNVTAAGSDSAHFLPSNSSNNEQTKRKKFLSSIVIESANNIPMSDSDKHLLSVEKDRLLPRQREETNDATKLSESDDGNAYLSEVNKLFDLLEGGKYAAILKSPTALSLFGLEDQKESSHQSWNVTLSGEPSMIEKVKIRLLNYFSLEINPESRPPLSPLCPIGRCIEMEIIGIASLNLFLQLNYTGPSLDRGLKPEEGAVKSHPLDGINPHGMFKSLALKDDDKVKVRGCFDPSVSSSVASSPILEEDDSSSKKSTETQYRKSAPTSPPSSSTIDSRKETNTTNAFHNAVLSELASDGEWPTQVCQAPYFLLLARAILSTLAEPTRPFRCWTDCDDSLGASSDAEHGLDLSKFATGCNAFVSGAECLSAAKLWNARAIVAHRRLIQTRRDDDDGSACPTLWNEAEAMFSRCLSSFCCDGGSIFDDDDRRKDHISGSITLEWGLAQHHFRKSGRGKASFQKALTFSKLKVEVTGAEGKRTKYQKKATAQYLVRAEPAVDASRSNYADDAPTNNNNEGGTTSKTLRNSHIEAQMIKHDDVSEDALLLEKIRFDQESDNIHQNLSILDQSILLALCLDVKNDNPMDGLTAEQMEAYLARVLHQHDDWMVYATALLERAWLECERTHGRERAILQIQALADQHSERLTLTQSTFKAAVGEDSARVEERVRNLHWIVYPPRWDVLRDLAERYAKLGIVTSAAEIFEELELWDEVVECYRLAGKEGRAEEVVRRRLAEKETPRMYAALGDLTKDPKYLERSLELSRGKFYHAHFALGKYYFEKGDLRRALRHFLDGLEIKPLMPAVWFRVGTIGMQLREWDTALRAFSEVVQQEPEEGDAWANVAAIHMYRKNPAEAYPALLESLKQNRSNWRVWVSKLYTCIDLKKYDEAIQACDQLLDMKTRRNSSEGIPPLEEKCIRAIVGGTLQNYRDALISTGDRRAAALDSSKRTLARLRDLLDKMDSTTKSDAWVYEVSAHLNSEMGWGEDVIHDLMKEYRVLQTARGWETDPVKISKMTGLLRDIFEWHRREGSKEGLFKCRFLLSGAAKKIRAAIFDSDPPKEVEELDKLISDLDTN